ncbi:MAG: molybdopterin-binding protein, partial [Acidobacteriota bacterium]
MSLNHAELIAIGTELLDPWHLDTNGAYLTRQLGTIGIAVRFRTVVGDDPDDLTDVFRIALGRSDLIIATGGLGPTIDDRTRETVAALLGRPLEERAGIVADLETRYAQIGLGLSEGARRQASVPRDAVVLPNRRGSAPGLLIREGKATIALLPGVPAEMREMVVDSLLSRLESGSTRIAYRTLLIAGLTESEVDRRLDPVAKNAAGIGWTILASPGQVSIHLSEPVKGGEEATRIAVTETEIRRILGDRLFAVDNETMEGVVGRLLHDSGGTLAVAESMTGGGVA